jgi:hypothetical protein
MMESHPTERRKEQSRANIKAKWLDQVQHQVSIFHTIKLREELNFTDRSGDFTPAERYFIW